MVGGLSQLMHASAQLSQHTSCTTRQTQQVRLTVGLEAAQQLGMQNCDARRVRQDSRQDGTEAMRSAAAVACTASTVRPGCQKVGATPISKG